MQSGATPTARARAALQSAGVSTRFVSERPGDPTGLAVVCVTPDGDNAIVVAPGANASSPQVTSPPPSPPSTAPTCCSCSSRSRSRRCWPLLGPVGARRAGGLECGPSQGSSHRPAGGGGRPGREPRGGCRTVRQRQPAGRRDLPARSRSAWWWSRSAMTAAPSPTTRAWRHCPPIPWRPWTRQGPATASPPPSDTGLAEGRSAPSSRPVPPPPPRLGHQAGGTVHTGEAEVERFMRQHRPSVDFLNAQG